MRRRSPRSGPRRRRPIRSCRRRSSRPRRLLVPSIHGGPDIPVFLFRPADTRAGGGAILHIHGGGMVMGSVLQMQAGPAMLAAAAGVPVASVEYRLAPESPFPRAAGGLPFGAELARRTGRCARFRRRPDHRRGRERGRRARRGAGHHGARPWRTGDRGPASHLSDARSSHRRRWLSVCEPDDGRIHLDAREQPLRLARAARRLPDRRCAARLVLAEPCRGSVEPAARLYRNRQPRPLLRRKSRLCAPARRGGVPVDLHSYAGAIHAFNAIPMPRCRSVSTAACWRRRR